MTDAINESFVNDSQTHKTVHSAAVIYGSVFTGRAKYKITGTVVSKANLKFSSFNF